MGPCGAVAGAGGGLRPGRCAPALGAILCALAVGTSEVWSFDYSRYRPATMRELIKRFKPQKGVAVTRDVPIRTKVTYAGEFRDLPEDSRRLLRAWAGAMNVAGIVRAFEREVKVRQEGDDYWIPVQEVLVPDMRAELRPGEEIELFMIYIGQIDGRHLLLINAFEHEGPHRAR